MFFLIVQKWPEDDKHQIAAGKLIQEKNIFNKKILIYIKHEKGE
jgi:hypothetical protein